MCLCVYAIHTMELKNIWRTKGRLTVDRSDRGRCGFIIGKDEFQILEIISSPTWLRSIVQQRKIPSIKIKDATFIYWLVTSPSYHYTDRNVLEVLCKWILNNVSSFHGKGERQERRAQTKTKTNLVMVWDFLSGALKWPHWVLILKAFLRIESLDRTIRNQSWFHSINRSQVEPFSKRHTTPNTTICWQWKETTRVN